MKELNFRTLRADEIEVRRGQNTKDGSKFSLLLYKDARCDMNMLDEVTGSRFNWQREHKDVHGVSYCGVGIWDEDKRCWVFKWDAGEKSNTAPEKGEASDAFKRACVNWGIGRELYTAPQIWVPASTNIYDLGVTQIEYNEKREIIALVISDRSGRVVYQKGCALQPIPPAPVVTKGGAIFPAKEPERAEQWSDEMEAIYECLNERELNEYNEACKQMKNASNRSELVGVYSRYKEAVFAPLLLEFGNRIIKEKGL